MFREDRSRSRIQDKNKERSQSFRVIECDKQDTPVFKKTIKLFVQKNSKEQDLFPGAVKKFGQKQTELQKIFGHVYDQSLKTGKRMENIKNVSQLKLGVGQIKQDCTLKNKYQKTIEFNQSSKENTSANRSFVCQSEVQTKESTKMKTKTLNLSQFAVSSDVNMEMKQRQRSPNAQLIWGGDSNYWKKHFVHPQSPKKRVFGSRRAKEQIDQKKKHYKKGCLVENNQRQFNTKGLRF